MARTAKGIAMIALTAATITGAAAKTEPEWRNSTNQPAPMTIGGTTRTRVAPLPASRCSNDTAPRSRISSARRALTSASERRTEPAAEIEARTRLVTSAARKASSPAIRTRSARSPATTVAAIGPATKRKATPMRSALIAASGTVAVAKRREETGRFASPATTAPSRARAAKTRTVNNIWTSVRVTARAGSKSNLSDW